MSGHVVSGALILVLSSLSAWPAGAQSQVATFPGIAPGDRHSVVVGSKDLDGGGLADVVVGAPDDDTAGNGAGAVYAYSAETGLLLWAQYGNAPAARFGTALAFTPDVNGDFVFDVVVGAPNAMLTSTVYPGHVRVLSGSDGTVLYTGWGDDHNEGMGHSVAGFFQWNSGNFDFAGGAPYDDDGGTDAGSFRVWSGDNGTLLATIHGDAAGDLLGYSMSAVGDLTQDGSVDLAVGAPSADLVKADVGIVRTYDTNGAVIWTKSGFVAGDAMGWAVAGAQDVNGDGYADVLAGEPGNIDNGPDAGRVRVFSGVNGFQLGVWRGDGAGDRFGSSLAFAGNLDGDSYPDFGVGAPQTGVGPGYARIISGGTGSELFTLTGDANGDEFGSSIAYAGVFRSFPGLPTSIAVGARNYDGPAGADTGMARVYAGTCPGVVNYCTAGISASGCQPAVQATGTPSASALTGFVIMASDVEGDTRGLFFFGWNGRQANGWGNGTSLQCVQPPVKRTPVQDKAGAAGQCNGDFVEDLNAYWQAKPNKNPGAGAVVQAQYWYRDPQNTSNQTTSLSDALEFVVCP